MQKKKTFKLLFSLMLVLPLFSGCKKDPGIETKPVDYNAVFIESDRVVSESKVVTYPGPTNMETSSKCDIKVNGEPLFVYETLVNYNRQFSWSLNETYAPVVLFDFEGKIHLDVEINEDVEIKSASLSPLAYQVPIKINGNTISFDLEYQTNYILTYNDDYKTAIHIFTNGIEENPITEEDAALDPNIVYIGPGCYKADSIPIFDNCIVYIAGGAYVYGDLHGEVVNNVTIKGHGIISGDIYSRSSEADYNVPVVMRNATNITLEDLTFLNPAGWALNFYKCSDVTIKDIKIITARQNGDGISLQSCQNVTVTGGFVRTWDDSLVVKNNDLGVTENILFDGVTVWTDLAQSMEVGYETYGAYMKDITFRNITVLNNFHKAAISIHNSDQAEISNVNYENITIEKAYMFGDNQTDGENDYLIDFTIAYSIEWTKSGGDRGSIDGVNVTNVKVYEEGKIDEEATIKSRIFGESAASKIKNVTIKGVEIEGRSIANKDQLKLIENDYTSNVKVIQEEVHGAEIALPYKLDLTSQDVLVTSNPPVEQSGILTPAFAWQKGERSYIGNPATSDGFSAKATHGVGTTNRAESDDGSGEYSHPDYPSSNAIDKNEETFWRNKEWKNEEDEFVALTIEFNRAVSVGTIRLIGEIDNIYYSEYTLSVWVKKDPAKNYVRSIGLREYEMSPIHGNYIDINITAQEYYGIQFRLFRRDSVISTKDYRFSEIMFYQPSLAFSKPIVDASEHNDVYTVNRVNDGDPTGTSYYETKELPGYFVIDLGDVYNVKVFGLFLVPSLKWSARTQEIEILVSDSTNAYQKETTEFTSVVPKTAFLFDPASGNNNIINLDSSVKARYVKVIIYSNSDKGGYGGQLSEFTVYEE